MLNELVLSDVRLTANEDGIVRITITRGKKLNALNTEVLCQLYQCFDAVDKDKDARVVILTGEGEKAFAAGADLKEITEKESVDQLREYYIAFNELYSKMRSIALPVIAKVKGYAFGGGCLLALACDFVIASKDALFSQPEVNFGFTGGAALLSRLVGRHKAAEITMLGKNINADEALRLNIVNEVVDNEQIDESVEKLAAKLLKKDAFALGIIKKIINNSMDSGLSAASQFEDECSAVALARPESKALIEKFINK